MGHNCKEISVSSPTRLRQHFEVQLRQARDRQSNLEGSAAPQMKRSLIPNDLLIPLFQNTLFTQHASMKYLRCLSSSARIRHAFNLCTLHSTSHDAKQRGTDNCMHSEERVELG